MRRTLTLVALLLLAPAAAADVVELKGGTRLEGVVLESGDRGARILLPGGDQVAVAKADVRTVTIEPGGPGGAHFTRYSQDGAKPGLQTGLVHYEKAGAPRVDLVGVVHVGDASYYREIQSVLDREDVVLYEMVRNLSERSAAKPAPVADPAGDDLTALRKFQLRLAEMLDLSFQVDGIDYRRKNLVHADMTLDEFNAQGGETFTKEIADKMALIAPLLDLVTFFARGLRVKSTVAKMLGEAADESGAVLGGLDVDGLIITKRNEVCMAMFDAVVRSRDAKSIAIFYGSGHMVDLEKRLLARGYTRVGGRWLTAWDVSEKPAAPRAKPAPPASLPAPTPVPAMN